MTQGLHGLGMNDGADKEVAKQAFIEGWKTAIGKESYKPVTKRTMESLFERWWQRTQE